MKEKVLALAKGSFTYNTPSVVLNPAKISMTVTAGEKKTAYIDISNSRKTKIKGFGSVEEQEIQFLPVFDDEENCLELVVDAANWSGRKNLQGKLTFVTDCGEAVLPYEITVRTPLLADEKGEVPDYMALQKRIRSNPENAAELFHSPDFRQIFLAHDTAGRICYDHLTARAGKLQSMEEFLVAMGKKQVVHFDISHKGKHGSRSGAVRQAEYELAGQDIQDSVKVRLSTWGSIGIRIYATEDFIVPSMQMMWSDEFESDTDLLEYTIAADRVRPGRREGKLVFESPYEKKEFRISVHNPEGSKERKVKRAKKAVLSTLMRMYLAYREERVPKEEFQNLIWNHKRVIAKIENPYQTAVKGFIPAILRDSAGMLAFYQEVERIGLPPVGSPLTDVENYVLIQFIQYLYSGKEEAANEVCRLIDAYEKNGYDSFILFYLRLMTDKKYEDIHIKAQDIQQRIAAGANSPLLYSELIRLYREDPTLISELDGPTIGAVCYGIREDLLTDDMAVVLSFLTERAGRFEPAVFHIMTSVYEKFQSQDMLRAICSLLIRNEAAGKKYFHWFEEGVKNQLRITDLYEYYMYTMDRVRTVSMPQSVLSYFRYENHLNLVCKAFLYAYIIKKRETFPEIFEEYAGSIREFALTQLSHHRISEDLGVIYEAVIAPEDLVDSVARELPQVMFTELLTCYHPGMEGVYVVHTQSKEEQYYPIVAGTAKIHIYTPDYQLYFVDREGNYHIGTVEYRLQKLLHMEEYAPLCYENGARDSRLLVFLATAIEKSMHMDGVRSLLLRDALLCGALRDHMCGRMYLRLYEYYKKQENAALLTDVLAAWDPALVKKDHAAAVATDCVWQGLYDKAEQLLLQNGIRNCDKKALAALVTNRIREKNGEFSPMLEKWALFLYREHYYEWEPLYYLLKYYMGSTRTLTAIYKKCREFAPKGIEDGCRERVLGQVLFTGTSPVGFESLFEEYYNNGSNRILVKAFLSEYAYEYLTGRIGLDESVFVKIEKQALYEKEMIMVLATLRYYSDMREYAKKQRDFIEIQLERCATEGVILSFMKKFCGKLNVPYEIENCLFAEHYSGTDKGVFLFLKDDGEDSYQGEPMKKIFDGIYVRELLLFADEEKRGYIYEEENGSKSKEISFRLNARDIGEDGFYPILNGMIEAKKHEEHEKYTRLREKYLKSRQIADQLFQMR